MRILIVAGGTGGHLFPAIRLGEELALRGYSEVSFVTSSRKRDKEILKKECATLPIIPLQSKSPLAVLNFIARLFTGTIKSLFLILRLRPEVVVGFGGYLTGPIVLLAALLGKKTIIHEQNVYPGKANRMLAGSVDKIAVSFPETLNYLKKFESKIVVSGNLLRRELKKNQPAKNSFTILAMGGSQGAHALNRLIPEAVGLMDNEKKHLLEMIHIAGYKDEEDVKRLYADKDINNRVFSFTEDIAGLYSECDFVIGRSGATTVSELLYLGKPSILIPYPHGNGHQRLNAKILGDRGDAILLEEKGLRAEHLRDAIMKFMDKGVLREMSARARSSNATDACDTLIKAVIE
ncbi:MAG: undecaprenyldiphospho-muramoylpentapeptide beta-N-acetylglucosaminyltransferase [Candidatus Omnitrophica bacterium]|nr:undecaprenyldiphospho-muramoylpentapeptide beta-N-acetylglucosaminyltransferase [Candidatus Omnitrophota bacterium]